MNRSELRNLLFEESQRCHRKWEIAVAIGATRETIEVLRIVANSRTDAFQRAYRAEKAAEK